MSTLRALRQALGKAVDKLDNMTGDAKAFANQERVVEDLEEKISAKEREIRGQARRARPGAGGDDGDGFKNLGEQLLAIARSYQSGGQATDSRLIRAPAGMSESNPADGGFLIQQEFSSEILQRVNDMGQISSRVRRLPITVGNGTKIPGVDETSRARGSRWGGVRAYWVGEGVAATTGGPKFRTVELNLKKLMATFTMTEELMQDAPLLAEVTTQAFSEELNFELEDAIVRGGGAGTPKGILGSAAKIAVAKESGQAAATIKFENIVNMWARLYARSQQDAVWYVNQDVAPQLIGLNAAVSTAGGQLVYMPPGGLSEAPYGTLMGRPVIPVEYCETLGTEGDIILADMSQYVLADKGGVNMQSSIHVAFSTDETVFKATYRVDGQPIWHAARTPYKGTNTVSPFITLATRS